METRNSEFRQGEIAGDKEFLLRVEKRGNMKFYNLFYLFVVEIGFIFNRLLIELVRPKPSKGGYYPSTKKEFSEKDMHEVGIQINKSWLLDDDNRMTPRQITDQVISKIRKDS